jgi:hypothetical protein
LQSNGGTGNAGGCGHHPLATLAEEGGFALVCAEGVQDILGSGGQWFLPEVITDETGTPCTESDSLEIPYMSNAMDWLSEQKESGRNVYDTSRIFFSGCSMGSAFTGYISQCWKQAHPNDISAFATDATGLKVKGDGAILPKDVYNTDYTWGECPDCQYFPFKPVGYSDSLGLKACIFDNLSDGAFYQTSVNLGKLWPTLGEGNTAETFLEGEGHHCQLTTYSYTDLVNCVDDGTGRLLSNALPPSPTPAPTPTPTPTPGPTPSDEPSADCQQCFIDGCPQLQDTAKQECYTCVQEHQSSCSSSCQPYPFGKATSWYCDAKAVQV